MANVQSGSRGVDTSGMTGDGSGLRRCVPLLVVALLVGLAPTSSAAPGARLSRAHAELTQLTNRISQQAATVSDLEGRVVAADRRIATAERALGLVLGARLEVRDQLLAARVAYADAQQDNAKANELGRRLGFEVCDKN